MMFLGRFLRMSSGPVAVLNIPILAVLGLPVSEAFTPQFKLCCHTSC